MKVFSQIVNFYIASSLHVALAAAALVMISFKTFAIPPNFHVSAFVFLSTVFGYNFIKFSSLIWNSKRSLSLFLISILVISVLAGICAFCFFLDFSFDVQIVILSLFVLTLLYAFPLYPSYLNVRNWVGVKIYIVALSWVGATVVLPLVDEAVAFGPAAILACIQRFILIYVLVLIFDIIDLSADNWELKTVPQKIGLHDTKILGIILMLLFCAIDCISVNYVLLYIDVLFASLICVFLYFATAERPKYYSVLWVESIPIFWYLTIEFAL